MTRLEIINYLIRKNSYKSYLEIGVHKGIVLNGCNIENRVGVDPECGIYKGSHEVKCMTSDEYFMSLRDDVKFDIIFIDGMHEDDHVFRDIMNSLGHLAKGGIIVVHDCNPPEKFYTRPYSEYLKNTKEDWNGDVYRGYLRAVKILNLEYYTVDTDWGVGLIKYTSEVELNNFTPPSWEEFAKNRKEFLNLITVDEFKRKF